MVSPWSKSARRKRCEQRVHERRDPVIAAVRARDLGFLRALPVNGANADAVGTHARALALAAARGRAGAASTLLGIGTSPEIKR